jgi:hypothetical protein
MGNIGGSLGMRRDAFLSSMADVENPPDGEQACKNARSQTRSNAGMLTGEIRLT